MYVCMCYVCEFYCMITQNHNNLTMQAYIDMPMFYFYVFAVVVIIIVIIAIFAFTVTFIKKN